MRRLVALVSLLLIASGSVAVAAEDSVIVSAGWRLEEVSEDGRTLTLRYRSGGCYTLDRIAVDETEDAVTLGVLLRRPTEPISCPYPSPESADVTLAAPLGDRDLRHAPVTPDTPVSEAPRARSRLAGASRIETAVAISAHAFPDGAEVVYLARADDPADAVAGGSLTDGPILLVPSCGDLPQVVRAEIERLAPDRVVALGGPAAVCDALLDVAAGY